MTDRCKVGVATSVSAQQSYDPLDTLAYALENKFAGIQIFLNEQVVHDEQLRGKVHLRCQQQHLTLITHAPATLNWANLSRYPVDAIAKELFEPESKALLVHHFDETVSPEETLGCLHYLHEHGVVTCLENYFILGKETGEACFRDYLQLLIKAHRAGIDLLPVFDIPRLYHEKVHLVEKALPLIEEAFQAFKQANLPTILHLIDVYETSQARSSWCPLGKGIIPYTDIFKHVLQYDIPISMVIFEYEDKLNPLASRIFLEEHFLKHFC